MKRLISIIALTVLVFAACNKYENDIQGVTDGAAPEPEMRFVIDFTIKDTDAPDTRVVKDSWVDGDMVYIFFYGMKRYDSKYLELRYNGGQWEATPKGDLTASYLSERSTKKLKAVYLPFGNETDAWRNNNDKWRYKNYFYTYYLISESIDYTIDAEGDIATLSVENGVLPLSMPSNFVHFFLEDDEAYDCGASLRVSHLLPCYFGNISYNYLDVSEYYSGTSSMDPIYGAAIPGYVYEKGGKKGYVFCGKLNSAVIGNLTDYSFTLVKGNRSYSATADAKVLTSKSSVDISGLNWNAIPIEFVDLGLPSGTKWGNLNLGAYTESDMGKSYAWGDVNGYAYMGAEYRFMCTHAFSENNYVFWDKNDYMVYTKYVHEDRTECWNGAGAPDNLLQLETMDDAAYVTNPDWRIPTKEQWAELLDPTYCVWEEEWGPEGYGFRITSVVPGHENESIFLPLTKLLLGYERDSDFNEWQLAYWALDLAPSDYYYGPQSAYALNSSPYYYMSQDNVDIGPLFRNSGMLIRPVSH